MTSRLSTDDLAARGATPPDTDQDREAAGAPERDAGGEPRPNLLEEAQGAELRERWSAIQTGFVDEPRHSVEEADALVADVMHRLAESFSHERQSLEGQWDRGEQVSTEDLRVALQRYRGFFDRLLAA